VVRTTFLESIAFITKITVEFFSLMDSSDVHITTTTGFEGGFTKITVEFFSLMDTPDVHITRTPGCEGSVTFTAPTYFLHFYINTGELVMVQCSILY
jgi:hypothetical protein